MNWDALGAVGDAVSAIAVVVSLSYLAVQVRQANRQAQASAQTDWMVGWNDQVKGLAKDRQTVATIRNGLSDFASLQSDEKVIFQEHLAAMTNQWVLGKLLHTQGLLPTTLFNGATKVLVEFYSTRAGSPCWSKPPRAFRMPAMTNQWVLGKLLHTQGLLPTTLFNGATKVLVEFYSTPGGLSMLEQTASSIPYAGELLEAARTGNDTSWTAQFPWWSADRART